MILMYLKKLAVGLTAGMLSIATCAGFAVAGQGYELYKTALADMSLDEKAEEIRERDGYTEL